MNISQPVSSQLQSVKFTCLSSPDIKALSAKRITSATTFDSLLNPVSGGLYSAELGQFADNACATCGLKSPQCPGHCGHIELPTPCYHPTFMDQVLRMLRATCIYCNRLKMRRKDVNRFVCKLRLIRYGLVKEVQDLDYVRADGGGVNLNAEKDSEEESEAEDDDAETRNVIEQRIRFVEQSIAAARQEGTLSIQKNERTTNARRAIVQEFMQNITKSRKCGNCGGIGHKYRKDRFVKIFRKPLTEKERVKMIQMGLKAKDAVVELSRRQQANAGKKRKRDEGVADMDRSSSENEDEEDGQDVNLEQSSDGEPEVAGGLMDDDAFEGKATKKRPPPPEEYLNPSRVRVQLNNMFEREQEVLGLVYGGPQHDGHLGTSNEHISADMFFVHDLLVPPTRYRPEARTGNDEIAEAQENTLYKNVLNICETMANIQRELSGKAEPNPRYRPRSYADLETTWTQLQDAVNSLIDRDRNPLQGAAGRRNPDGVKQKLEKKEGMFRKYMMGKRVNFAARTVISPDPNIETNEIGVPPVFAVKLTYPEPVTSHNVEELQVAVRNGPVQWPGAVAIESESGQIISLERKNPEERTALANQLLAPSASTTGFGARGTRPKKVHRHLNNGDIVVMNRQPTLHKPSMMCHRARVLPREKTLRMHYSNCNTYNADFDGDEMNMHFPQNELARAEALSIADTDHQYLSATAGNPLRGLIQDHISMSVWLTNRDMFFDRAEYMQLLYAGMRPEANHCAHGRINTLPPAVIKPKALWTGKQVVSSILLNITPETHQGLTMGGKSTTEASLWGKEGSEEATVLVRDGYLCQGILDKKQIGPSSGGFVNAAYEAYGHTVTGRLLSILGRLLTRMLQTRAFSCGVEDLIFTSKGEADRQQALAGAATVGLEVAAKYVSLEKEKPEVRDREIGRRLEDVLRDETKQIGLDQMTNSATKDLSSAVIRACLPDGLIKPFPQNQMQTMTTSGAKGSKVNASQISCNLGQQVLEGRRVPVMVSGKTLPCFKPFESSVRAGGYIVDRFLTGVRPQEYFFHAMAGREGLIDTAVKTSRSGYLQRCLIKGMEGLRVDYDTSVRDLADGSMIQFLYGEDGLDVTKAKYIADFKFAAENHLSLFHAFSMRDQFDTVMSTDAAEYNKTAERKYRKTGDLGVCDPALALYSPATCGGSTSESLYKAARDYIDANVDGLIKDKKNGIPGRAGLSKRSFQGILDLRYCRSVVEAGEAVGVVAGQSVGEPSTQMTLNTFHLAGHSAKNVTLGIPRLREILMTAAANIATPTMTLRLNEEIDVEDARRFAKGISKLSLAEVLDKVTIEERTDKGIAYAEAKKYQVRLDLFRRAEYESEYAITVQDIVDTIEHRFLPKLQSLTRKEIKKRGDEKTLKAQIGHSAGTVEQERSLPEGEREGGNDDSDSEGDDDATRDKAMNNKQQAGYEAMEDDEEVTMKKRSEREEDIESEVDDEAYGGSPRSAPELDDRDRIANSAAKDREDRIKAERRTNDVVQFAFDDAIGDTCTFTMEYDSSTAKILMLHLVEDAARTSLIQSIDGLATAIVDEGDKTIARTSPPSIVTAGVNIPAMWQYQHIIHPHYLYTNSVHAILLHYGVEAARDAIVRELQSVFYSHSISVDPRHLTLIADYMTRDGVYQAFSRMGYRGHPSPFMKMSFETTVGFLRDAVLEGDWDDLKNPSARIVVGGLGGMGTGGFDVYMPLNMGGEESVKEEDEYSD